MIARALGTVADPRAVQYADHAMELAEALRDWERVIRLLSRYAVIWVVARRPTGAMALLRAAVDLGRRHHLPRAMIMPLLNLNAFLKNRDLDAALAAGREAVQLTLQTGDRELLRGSALNLALTCWVSGDWDEVETFYAQHHDDFFNATLDLMLLRSVVSFIRAARHEPVDFDVVVPDFDPANSTDRYGAELATALRAQGVGDVQTAADAFARSVDAAYEAIGIEDDFAVTWPMAVEAALAAGQTTEAERLLGYVADAPPGLVTPLAHAHLLRLRALVGIATGGDDASIDADLEQATEELREFGVPFYVARTLLERARRMTEQGCDEQAAVLLAEAEAIFGELRADRWLEETRRVSALQ